MKKLVKSAIKSNIKVLAILTILSLAPTHTFARPALFLKLIDSPVGKFIFSETREGKTLLKTLLGKNRDYYDLLKGVSEEVKLGSKSELLGLNPQEAAALTQSLREINQELEELRRLMRGKTKGRPEYKPGERPEYIAEITLDERLLLRELVIRKLKLNPKWKLGAENRDIFLVKNDIHTLFETRSSFLKKAPTMLDETLYILPKGAREVKDLFKRISACLKAQPKESKSTKFDTKLYTLESVLISEAQTITGYIAGAGQKKVDWVNLPTDMMVTGLYSMISTYLTAAPQTPFMVRWFNYVTVSKSRAIADATIYYLNPKTDTHGMDRTQATFERLGFNFTWSFVPSSLYNVPLTHVLTGLLCLNPGSRITRVFTYGSRLGVGFGSSILYFTVRNNLLGSSLLNAAKNHPAYEGEIKPEIEASSN